VQGKGRFTTTNVGQSTTFIKRGTTVPIREAANERRSDSVAPSALWNLNAGVALIERIEVLTG